MADIKEIKDKELKNVAGGQNNPKGLPKGFIFHKVQAGETLSMIAEMYDVLECEIIAYNNIKDPDLIYAGQSLKIPIYN